jgi:ribosomal RNA assembly protein
MIKSVLIPKERLSVLIGRKGGIKSGIEKSTKTSITVSDEVLIEGEPLDVMAAECIIRAIARGFSPEKAMKLANEENVLDVIELPKDEKALNRLRSRIIGINGKTRYKIECSTNTYISVYGKTVSIIGKYEDVETARAAIEKLISGFSHKSVYIFLESAKK